VCIVCRVVNLNANHIDHVSFSLLIYGYAHGICTFSLMLIIDFTSICDMCSITLLSVLCLLQHKWQIECVRYLWLCINCCLTEISIIRVLKFSRLISIALLSVNRKLFPRWCKMKTSYQMLSSNFKNTWNMTTCDISP